MQKAMKEAFTSLKKVARKMHLQINQGKQNICQLRRKATEIVFLI
jgi:hypothetical protein